MQAFDAKSLKYCVAQDPTGQGVVTGTRGFRAPEVLLICTAQTTKIDISLCAWLVLTVGRRATSLSSSEVLMPSRTVSSPV